jgi:hypothetical protein
MGVMERISGMDCDVQAIITTALALQLHLHIRHVEMLTLAPCVAAWIVVVTFPVGTGVMQFAVELTLGACKIYSS